MTAALYLRVSTDEQAERLLPIAGQQDECREFALSHGWPVAHEYSDLGISGARHDRPGLAALINDAHKGKFSELVCWDSSRLSRDTELAGWIRTELKRAGVNVHTVQGSGSSPLEGDAAIDRLNAVEKDRKAAEDRLRGVRAEVRQSLDPATIRRMLADLAASLVDLKASSVDYDARALLSSIVDRVSLHDFAGAGTIHLKTEIQSAKGTRSLRVFSVPWRVTAA